MADLKQLARELVPYLEPYLLSLRSGYVAATAYTPTYTGGTTAGTTTYNNQVGYYVRIAEVVYFTAFVGWTAATGTGDARVSLPLTAKNVASLRYTCAVRTDTVTFAASAPQGLIQPNTAYVTLYSPVSNGGSTAVAIEAAGFIDVSGMYFVDA